MQSTPDRLFAEHRFIPARAGNSIKTAISAALRTVHPRACGELKPSVLRAMADSGSFPRVRGTRTAVPAPCAYGRFIPARAGNL